MLNIELFRRHPDLVRQGLARRGEEDVVDQVLQLDTDWRGLVAEGDQLRAQRNEASQAIGQLLRQGGEGAQG